MRGFDAWVVLRLYAPAPDPTLSGQALTGGLPLPTISYDETAPLAAWCDKSSFERGGWQACLGRR